MTHKLHAFALGENTEYDKLPVGEAAIMDAVIENGSFRIKKSNGTSLTKLKSAFNKAISNEHRNVFYQHNGGWIGFGIFLTIAGLAATLFFNVTGLFELLISCLLVATSAVFMVPIYFLSKWVMTFENSFLRILFLGILGIAGLIGTAVVLAMVYFVFVNSGTGSHVPFSIPFSIVVVALIALNILFYDLMRRPTKLGAELMAQVEGLKLHLENYHEQRMNLSGTPKMSPRYFETQLPYAVALDIEKPWSEAFDVWLSSAEAKEAGVLNYEPEWDRTVGIIESME